MHAEPVGPDQVAEAWCSLGHSAEALHAASGRELWAAWGEALEDLLADSEVLDRLAQVRGEHHATTRAGAETLLSGLKDEAAEVAFQAAAATAAVAVRSEVTDREALEGGGADRRVALVVLAGNVPFLAAQSAFFALACRRPTLFKLPSGEGGDGTAELLAALRKRLPLLGTALRGQRWSGGAAEFRAIERQLAATAAPLVVYGDDPAIAAYRTHGGRQTGGCNSVEVGRAEFGARESAVLVAGQDVFGGGGENAASGTPGALGTESSARESLADAVAWEIALFEQRGCLSPRTVVLVVEDEDERQLTQRCVRWLAEGLQRCAKRLPPCPAPLAERAALRHQLIAAEMRGALLAHGDWGAVVQAPTNETWPTALPGRRVVWLVTAGRDRAAHLLRARAGRLQGLALAGQARDLEETVALLRRRGVRIASAGCLQRTGADWRNSGVDLAALFASPASGSVTPVASIE